MRKLWWSAAPPGVTPEQRQNFINVQIDAIGIGLSATAAQYLPVFLTRLGASNLQVGLLTSMPAIAGLLLAIPVGRFLQSRRQIVPWFSLARLLVVACYALTGLVTWLVPESLRVNGVLAIWAWATLPQSVLTVSFSVVMNAVAGPMRRYELMSRRWSILGVTTALTAALVGQILVRMPFPMNYQVVFIGLSVGGLISYYYSSHIRLPDATPPAMESGDSLAERWAAYWRLVGRERDFILFALKRLVYQSGTMLAIPLFPLYFVREVQASDSWIGIINTAQSAVLLVGYFLWTRESRLRGSRFVLLWTTFGLALYPALVSITGRVELIVLYAGLAGIFQAGLDLVFFDELMKTVPVEYSATFVSLAQSLQHLSAIFAPLLGTWLATYIGLSGALLVSAVLRFVGFALFAWWKRQEIVQHLAPATEVGEPEPAMESRLNT